MSAFLPERGSEAWEELYGDGEPPKPFKPERGSEVWEEMYGSTEAGRVWYRKKRFLIPAGAMLLLGTCVVKVANRPVPAHATSGSDWQHSVSSTGMDTAERSMSFDECQTSIRSSADELGVAPDNVVDSSTMRIVRFPTREGSVLVTCSAEDNKMLVVKSPWGGPG